MPTSICSPCLPCSLPFSPPLPSPSPRPALALCSLRQSSLFPPLSHRPASTAALPPRCRTPVCEIALQLDGSPSTEGQNSDQPAIGSRVRVLGPLKVYHVPKHPEFDLGGCEGELKDVLKTWKEKPISANFPYKVQFNLDLEGKQVKFFTHLKDTEFEVIG